MQESTLTDPALFIDNDAMHDRDLPGRPPEGKRCHPQPDPKRFTQADAMPGG